MAAPVSIGGRLNLERLTLAKCAVINSMYLLLGVMQSFAALRAGVLTLGSPKNFALFAENSLSHVWGVVTSRVAPANVDGSTGEMGKTFTANSAENLFTCLVQGRTLPDFAAKIVRMFGREEINSNTPARLVEKYLESLLLTKSLALSSTVLLHVEITTRIGRSVFLG